uniref:Uncharacterized protein n=1 Tax=Aureoumbra lagunensis TaxID=44058 RepID=A0A7S3K4Q8_9STRA
MNSSRRRNRSSGKSLLSFPETKRYFSRRFSHHSKQNHRGRSAPPEQRRSHVNDIVKSPRILLRRASLELRGWRALIHRIIVLLRICFAWIFGLFLASYFGYWLLAPPAIVLANLGLEILFCRGPIRRHALAMVLLTLSPRFGMQLPKIPTGLVGLCLATVLFPFWLTFLNAEAGLTALLICTGLAANFSIKEALLTFFIGYLLAPAFKFLVRCLRGDTWIDQGKWNLLEVRATRLLRSFADDLRYAALFYRQDFSFNGTETVDDSKYCAVDRSSCISDDGYHPVRPSLYLPASRPSMLISTSPDKPTDSNVVEGDVTGNHLDPPFPEDIGAYSLQRACSSFGYDDCGEHSEHVSNNLQRSPQRRQSLIAAYEPPKSRFRTNGGTCGL